MSQRTKSWRTIALILALTAVLFASRSGTQAQDVSTTLKVILRAGDRVGHQALIARNARLVSDYGAFSLWTVDDQGAPLAAMSEGLSVHPEFDQLLLREGTLDTSAQALGGQEQLGQEHQLHLVQFVGPVRDAWLADLAATGAHVVAYVPYNGYVVWADEDARDRIARRVAERIEYQWHGPFKPAYRLAGSLRGSQAAKATDVVVQVLNHAESERTVREIVAQSEAVLVEPHSVLNYVNLAVRVPSSLLPALAARADVVNVEPWRAPSMLDERQGQILAGNLNVGGTQPSGPGYLAWLDGLGFSKDPTDYAIVDVIDDGFDNGSASNPWHSDFYQLGSFANTSRVVYARDMTYDNDPHGIGGHGNLNVSIVGGYNVITDAVSLYNDGDGYNYGLGISPYGRMASTKVFNDTGVWEYFGSLADLIRGSYNNGARITNNSWGTQDEHRYTVWAQAFDLLTRDVDPTAPGNQEMAHVFSAGNEGSALYTVLSPGTAKNVVTVGASENVRQTGEDGCGVLDSEADDVQDMANTSSRGPTADGRTKPDVVAPGTHIQGAASQEPGYDGNGVCDTYWPSDQDLYTWSSGTSHAAPAIAGALSLIHTYFTQGMGGMSGDPPSPAMLKAYLLNSTRHINGSGTSGNLPSDNQGWGLADLGMAFDGVPRMLVDQSVLLDDSGQVYEMSGVVDDPSVPFRVTLAWTDAPGTPLASAWVNDLDLEVIVGGQTYKGNVFSGAASIAGGVADSRNNVESVFLPAGTSGPFTVRVIAYTIAGDGLPGNGDDTDQDFALVTYNASPEPDFEIGASPVNGEVCVADEITYTVYVTGSHGYTHTVSLAHGTPPPDVSLTLSLASGTPSFDAALRATTNASTTVGLYTLAVTGTAEVTRVREATVTLAVDSVAPTGTMTLISPTNGITGVALHPTLAWNALPDARSYRVQVAGDDAFTQLAVDQAVSDTSYQPDLRKDTTYYWRVIAQNGCGSVESPSRVFTTVNPVHVFFDSMEGGAGQWSVETAPGTAQWTLGDVWSHSTSHAWHVASAAQVTDARLATVKAVTVDASSTLSFWHWYNVELTGTLAGDGGVSEISVDGGNWQDLGPYITSGGYSHVVASDLGNPLAGRSAWSGESGGWRRVEVDLSAFAGSSVRVRFRWGGNTVDWAAPGWYVDDVRITSIWPPSKYKVYLSLVFRNQ